LPVGISWIFCWTCWQWRSRQRFSQTREKVKTSSLIY
jgi:hypothetical protein